MGKKYYRALTIAGSDSGGGAGIQADLKTFSALGCYGTSAVTAVTAQNTVGVRAIHPVPPDMIQQQIKAVLDDIGSDAVKIGMLHSSEVIEKVSKLLQIYRVENIVLDPVMVATSGDVLLEEGAIDSLRKVLVPMADIITPNIPEAEILLGESINSQSRLPEAAVKLSQLGCRSVLLKAGHLKDDILIDYFYDSISGEMTELPSQRLYTQNTHGTGCTLSSAVASFLARGFRSSDAVKEAKLYISEAISAGSDYSLGKGHGPVKHFHKYWRL